MQMKKAYIFPGQGSQSPGMAKELYQSNEIARHFLIKIKWRDFLRFGVHMVDV
jgi:malonyl CoA-acyl carrier protein transacylase